MVGKIIETRVEIGNGSVVGVMSSKRARESGNGVEDNGGDNDKRRLRSIRVGRYVCTRKEKEDEVGTRQGDGAGGGVIDSKKVA